ncbi:hypothetical protein [Gordonia polyisoprenivorans]|uniref:hypothetical protein n=1 Tax=Gordonia polyisoprenivorans TaxID=84595 RepID=UPI001AD60590|nr:hypothetical protein [Gordonia polyisoprenivorans]QTI68360.1 hypothetical protein J6U32_23160 [Gordonia polyisoprenivorans]
MRDEVALAAEFESWVTRLEMTYRAVRYTCGHRLGDLDAGGRIAAQVVASMLARPKVFRYSGLPFSGRIARVAEPLLVAAATDPARFDPGSPSTWAQIEDGVRAMPQAARHAFIGLIVLDSGEEDLAASLGTTVTSLRSDHAAALEHLRTLTGDVGPGEHVKGV